MPQVPVLGIMASHICYLVSISEISRPKLTSEAKYASLCLAWSETNVGYFGHGRFGHGHFGQDILATDISAM